MASSKTVPGPARSWIFDSVSAAAVGALAAALVESWLRLDGVMVRLAGAGYTVLGLWPALALGSMIARLALAGWLPEGTSAPPAGATGIRPLPRLPAHVLSLFVVISLSLLALGAVAWGTVAWAALNTAFHARTLAALAPMPIVACGALIAALAWPVARGLARLFHGIDARRRGRRARPLFTGWRVGLFIAAVALAAALLLLRFLRVQIGLPLWPIAAPLLAMAMAPALALAAAAAWHLAAARLGRLRAAGRIASLVAAAATAGALWLRATEPALLLDVWGHPVLAATVIGRVHSLEALRGDLNPAAVALAPLPGVTTHPDVVLITIDTVRADRVPPQNPAAAMPTLAGLVARGAVFTRAFAPSSTTRRSLPSLVTSLAPTRVRGRMSGWALQLDPRHVLLAERFAAAGYETAGFLCCDHFWARSAERDMGWSRGLQTLQLTRDGAQLAEQARRWLAERAASAPAGAPTGAARRPLFVWVHLLEPHEWNGGALLLPPAAEVLPRYDATLARVDAMVATVMGGLARSPRPPLVAITSDHGEGLGEHGAVFHSANLYNSLLRIPLVIAGPGVVPAQHAEVVSLLDVAPTLIELAGFAPPPPPVYEGRSLAQLAQGRRQSDDEGGYAYAAMLPDHDVTERREAIVRGRWKLISSRRGLELYDYIADPKEETNLAGSAPQRAELWQLLMLRRGIDERSPFTPLAR